MIPAMISPADIPTLRAECEALKARIDASRPWPTAQVKSLRDWFTVAFTAQSNGLEGNTYTESEVRVLVQDGITVGGKTVRETLETQNLAAVTRGLWDVAEAASPLDEKFLLNLHRAIVAGTIPDAQSGAWRTTPVFISGDDKRPPAPSAVPGLMADWFAAVNACNADALECSAKAHYDFVKIHPFHDGNGRTARLVMNLILVRGGWLPAIIPTAVRADYVASLHSSRTFDDFFAFFLWQVRENLKDYVRFFEEK